MLDLILILFLEFAVDYNALACLYTLQTHAIQLPECATECATAVIRYIMNFQELFCVSLRPSINTSKDKIYEQKTPVMLKFQTTYLSKNVKLRAEG